MITQKRIAAKLAGCSPKRVKMDTSKLAQIKEAITSADVRSLISNGSIKIEPKVGVSRGRARLKSIQKSKGRRKGHGSRKGRAYARSPKKQKWMNKIRLQREFIIDLKNKNLISKDVYKDIYYKAGGGFFRSKRHVKLYLEEKGIFKRQ